MTELEQIESTLARELQAFDEGLPERRRAKRIARPTEGLTVRLAVRRHRLAPDEELVHTAGTISRLQARLEAERKARDMGLTPAYVIDYE